MTTPRGPGGKFAPSTKIATGGPGALPPPIPGRTVEAEAPIGESIPSGAPLIESDNRPQEAPKRGPGRPRKDGSTPRSSRPRAMNPAPPGEPATGGALDADIAYRQMGIMSAGLFIAAGVGVFGDEWKPDQPEEQHGLEIAATAYFKAKGIGELSPGWVLLGAVAAYSIPRLQRPATAEKLDRWTAKLARRAPDGPAGEPGGIPAVEEAPLPVDTGASRRGVPHPS